MNIELHGGKTAPRLLNDLDVYDPRKLPPSGFNILSDLIFHDDGLNTPPLPSSGRGSCRHNWSLKPLQCRIPKRDDPTTNSGQAAHVAAFCPSCRSHLKVQFVLGNPEHHSLPCPSEWFPLHHFRHVEDRSTKLPEHKKVGSEPGFAWADNQCFECTSSMCAARLLVSFRPARLKKEWVALLTDKHMIRARAEQAMAKDPQKYEGIAVPSSVNVLEYLSQYIRNALSDPPDPNRKIKTDNKKFATSFGDACSELLFYLGFTREGDYWFPPRPAAPDQATEEPDHLRPLLDDVWSELHVLMFREPGELLRGTKQNFQLKPAKPELSALLGCDVYKKRAESQNVDLTVDEHPFYAGLGAVADFPDDLIDYSYNRQVLLDRVNLPYYLECLQVLAQGRSSEFLLNKAAVEEAEGKISLKDIRDAYSNIGINARDPSVADETIIAVVQARIADAPKQEAELRNTLRIIGQSRQSEKMQQAASHEVATYDQAMRFLGAEESTPDEFIPSMLSVKISEKASDEAVARQAVTIIANHRRSKALKSYLETGTLGEVEMDVSQAYIRLDISDRTIDDGAVLAAYEVNITDQPSQAEDINRALTAIAKSRNSASLLERLGLSSGDSGHKLSEWPVGIDNIGNTCYLNSLLQFYFTIKPLRDLVLNVEDFKMPLDASSLAAKRVGSRNVSKKEVLRAQQFVDELQALFKNLITSTSKSFKPSPEVARLTLLSSSKAEIARRQSLISAERPTIGAGLGHINGISVQGPVGPPAPPASSEPETTAQDTPVTEKPESPNRTIDTDRSDTTSDTLVNGTPTPTDAMDIDPKDAQSSTETIEAKAPSASSIDHSSNAEPINNVNNVITGAPDVLDLNDQAIQVEAKPSMSEQNGPDDKPPDRPPPFPPRPHVLRETTDAIREAEYGAQQDVTEVIANVLFQLQCAIKPESTDGDGEQLDQIKSLFFGKQKSYTTDKAGKVRTSEEYITDIKVDVASGPRDIYAALDGAFDVQDVEVGGGIEPQYATISQLPPILSILIQRAQFDPAKKTTFKSENHLELKDPIFMDRYLDDDDADLKQRREQSWAWKKQILACEKRHKHLAESELRNMSMPTVLESTWQYLKQIKDDDDGNDEIDISDSLLSKIEGQARAVQSELEDLETAIRDLGAKISSQFVDMRKIPYRLASVFMHVGSHNTGHYWIYIYDFKTELWRKYNDEKISQVVDLKEIFEAPGTPRPPTPYYLVYVRDDLKDELVSPVCRDVMDPPPEEERDTPMEDFEEIPVPKVTPEMIKNMYAPIHTQNAQVIADGAWNPAEDYTSDIHW